VHVVQQLLHELLSYLQAPVDCSVVAAEDMGSAFCILAIVADQRADTVSLARCDKQMQKLKCIRMCLGEHKLHAAVRLPAAARMCRRQHKSETHSGSGRLLLFN
jgi:hypothetical protein